MYEVPETERMVLESIRDDFRSGKIKHYKVGMGDLVDTPGGGVFYNQYFYRSATNCGMAMCIAGFMADRLSGPVKVAPGSLVLELCDTDREAEISKAYDSLFHDNVSTNTTPKQAARAIDRFLSGKVRKPWSGVIR